jgi:hypothetical protein
LIGQLQNVLFLPQTPGVDFEFDHVFVFSWKAIGNPF